MFVIRLWKVHRFKSSKNLFLLIIEVDGVGNSDIILSMREGWLVTKFTILLIRTATPVVNLYRSWNYKSFFFFHLLEITIKLFSFNKTIKVTCHYSSLLTFGKQKNCNYSSYYPAMTWPFSLSIIFAVSLNTEYFSTDLLNQNFGYHKEGCDYLTLHRFPLR